MPDSSLPPVPERPQTSGDCEDSRPQLVEHAGIGMCSATPSGRIVYLNPALRRLLGLLPEAQAAELSLQRFCRPEERQRLEREILPAAVRQGAWQGELPLLAQPGHCVPVWLDIRRTDGGAAPALACSFTDLGRWKGLERDLRESAMHQRTLADYIPQRVFVKDRQSRYLAANRSYAADLGITPEDIIGRDDYAFHPAELAAHYQRMDRQVLADGLTEEFDESYVQDERECTIHTVKTPVRDGDGEIIGICGIFWDVSEQRRLEARLKESETTLRTIYESVQEGMMLASMRSGLLTMANPAMCRLLGYDETEIVGRPPLDFHPPAVHARVEEIFADMLRGEFRPVEELPFQRKDGSLVYVDVSATRISIGGEPSLLGVFRDVTAHREARAELARSEALLAEAQSLVHLGNWNQDLVTRQTYWSDEMYRLFGYAPGAVPPGRDVFLQALPPEERETVLAAMDQPLSPGENGPFRVEHRVRRPDGERIVEQEWRIVCAADGTPLRAYGTALDITERRTAQARAEMLQRVADNATQGIGWADLDGRVRYMNRALRELLAVDATEDTGRYCLYDFHPAAVHRELEETVLSAIMEQGHWTGEFDMLSRDGRTIPTLQYAFIIRDGAGRPIALANVVTDLRERKQAEAELARYRDHLEDLVRQRTAEVALQSQRNATILNNATDGFFTTDLDGRFTDVNPAFCDMLGHTRAELLAREVRDVEFAESPAEVASHIARICATGHDRFESRHRRKDGSPVDVEISANRVEIAGHPELFCFVRDISDRKRHEAALLASHLEAERANAAKSEFLSRMSHELRTPLNAIIGFAQLLEIPSLSPLAPQQAESVHEILKAGQHLLRQVNEILDLARIESGRVHLDIEAVPLAPLVAECIGQLRPLAAAQAIAIENALPADLALAADAAQLKLVLLNLLSNAIKYNRRDGRIGLQAAAVPLGRRITVSDTGRGIPPAQLDRLFRPFERLESSYDGIEGTGIGLALAKKLVEAMGGSVGVASTPGVGSEFWFELPVAEPAPAPAPAEKVGAGGTAPAAVPATRRAVLYIEDNPANLKLVRKLLETQRQIRMHDSLSAEQGLEIARRERPDLILLDINLPGMDGFAALARLRADAETRNIPVVAVTANAMKRDVERGKAAGFDDYLAKPFNIADLLQLIDRHLSARP